MLIHSAEITGSVQFNNTDVSGITNVAGFATTGSNQFNGNQSISGSITSNGTITAQTLVVQTVTSSVEFITGSTRNGSIAANTHQFTGSVFMSNSLGIGTSSPNFNSYGTALTLLSSLNYGGIEIYGSGSTKGGQIDFGSGNVRYASISGEYESSDNGFTQIRTRRAGTMTDAIRITSDGNIGIGTTNPSTRLTISKPIDASSYGSGTRALDFKIFFPGFDVDTVKSSIYVGVSSIGSLNTQGGYMGFMTSLDGTLAERVRIEKNGDVGIGTTTPGSRLDVNGTVKATRFTSAESTVAIPNSATTIFDAGTGGSGVWLVTAVVQGNGIQAGYAIVGMRSESTLYLLASGAGGQMTFSVSGTTLRLSQSAGGTINTSISVMRINQGG